MLDLRTFIRKGGKKPEDIAECENINWELKFKLTYKSNSSSKNTTYINISHVKFERQIYLSQLHSNTEPSVSVKNISWEETSQGTKGKE